MKGTDYMTFLVLPVSSISPLATSFAMVQLYQNYPNSTGFIGNIGPVEKLLLHGSCITTGYSCFYDFNSFYDCNGFYGHVLILIQYIFQVSNCHCLGCIHCRTTLLIAFSQIFKPQVINSSPKCIFFFKMLCFLWFYLWTETGSTYYCTKELKYSCRIIVSQT